MDSFNKKISELYNGEQTPEFLPEGFGWDEMSEGIYDKMEEPKRKRKFFWIWFIFGTSIALLAVLFFFYNHETKENTISTTDAITEFNERNTTTNAILSEKTSTKNNPVSSENNGAISTEAFSKNKKPASQHTDFIPTKKKVPSAMLTTKNRGDNFKADLGDPKFPLITSSLVTKVSSAKVVSNSNQNSKTKVNSKLSSKTKRPSDNEAMSPIKPLAFLSTKRVQLIAETQGFSSMIDHLNQTEFGTINIALPSKKNRIHFAKNLAPHLYGGTLLTSGAYTENQLRNKHSKWSPGYFTGIEFTVLTYKKWRINLGYEHKFAVQVFDFQNITDTVTTVMENVLTGISTYSLDGSTTETRENISTLASRTRNYIHYNTFRSHAIKMTLARSFKLSNQWNFMAGLGGSYNFLNRTQGRTIEENGNTLDYDSENAIYRKNNWGIEGGFSLGYQIGKVSLLGNFWVEKSLNYSSEPVEEIRPVFYKIGLGVKYSF